MRLHLFQFVMLLMYSSAVSAQYENPASAYIQQLAIDPSNTNILYAATTSAGLYKSTDGAEVWQAITPDTTRQYYVVRIDPSNPNRIYAGGEKSGLWISNDRSSSWEAVQLPGVTICEMAITPSDPNRIFVMSPNGVYRTHNIHKNKWEKVFDYFSEQQKATPSLSDELRIVYSKLNHEYAGVRKWIYTRFQKIAVSPHDPNIIMLGARWEGGYWRSEDGGETWHNHWISGMFRRVDPIIFHPSDPNVIYVGTHHQGWFKTYNNGKSWINLSRGMVPQPRNPYYGAVLISGVVMNPQNPDEFYTGSDYSNWKTTNGGLSWQELGRSLTCEFARSFAVDPQHPDIVYAGSNVGIFKSKDAGKTWLQMNRGFPSLPVKQALDVDIHGIRYRYVLTEKGPQIFRKPVRNDGRWQSMNWLLTSKVDSLTFDPINQILVLKTQNGDITSNDGGVRWSLPELRYKYAPVVIKTAPFQGNRADKNFWTLDITIEGSPHFADNLVDDYYKRPPFVSIQLVSANYPVDGSAPIWEGNFERHLKGTIQIPKKEVEAAQKYLLYVEARDFQWNVLTGHTTVFGLKSSKAVIQVRASHLLPALCH